MTATLPVAQASREAFYELAETYYAETHPEKPFRPGIDLVPVSGKVVDSRDLQALLAY